MGMKAKAKFVFPELGSIDASKPKAERLRQLASLMTHPDNGRFARTIVNRLWARLMGQGIVEPVDVMGNEPWSVDLLDFLASDLVENKYDLKHTLELLLTSEAYQSKSIALTKDSTNSDFRHRGPIAKRMTAEQFVDAVWGLTGTFPAKPDAQFASFGDRNKQPVRASLVNSNPLMRSLGRPNREQVVTTRPSDLSTLQALDLSNGQLFAQWLDQGAKNLRKAHPKWQAEDFTNWLYRGALERLPTDQEESTAKAILGEKVTDEGLSDLLWIVFMLPEFQLIR
jgi:hypothetical protein